MYTSIYAIANSHKCYITVTSTSVMWWMIMLKHDHSDQVLSDQNTMITVISDQTVMITLNCTDLEHNEVLSLCLTYSYSSFLKYKILHKTVTLLSHCVSENSFERSTSWHSFRPSLFLICESCNNNTDLQVNCSFSLSKFLQWKPQIELTQLVYPCS